MDAGCEKCRENAVEKLIDLVNGKFSKTKSVQTVVKEVFKATGWTDRSIVRRNFDGCSEVKWLIEKMIGELLIYGKIND
jgi:hypothetical protein